GEGATQDILKAKYWYEKASEQNEPIALTYLAGLYEYSNFGEIDYNKAKELYIRAIKTGYPLTQKHLNNLNNIMSMQNGIFVPQKADTAEEYLELGRKAFGNAEYQFAYYYMNTAAMMGNGEAMQQVGHYSAVSIGCPVNLTNAVFWLYRSATEFNNRFAYYNLGNLFRCGSGVRENALIAIDLFEKADEYGHSLGKSSIKYLKKEKEKMNFAKVPYSLINPNKCLEKAKELIESGNDKDGYSYLYSSAMRGNAEAQNLLGAQNLKNANEPSRYPEAMFWFLKAAYNGYAIAYENIGTMFEMGLGADADLNLAKMYYGKAAANGVLSAAEKQKKLN
ncbi:MAG: tetratricopeptide repeat protein, partial [Oscillospiraceae bacterium]